jgi:hypothetical protein
MQQHAFGTALYLAVCNFDYNSFTSWGKIQARNSREMKENRNTAYVGLYVCHQHSTHPVVVTTKLVVFRPRARIFPEPDDDADSLVLWVANPGLMMTLPKPAAVTPSSWLPATVMLTLMGARVA